MALGPLSFKYEASGRAGGLTAFAGLGVVLDLMALLELRDLVQQSVRLRHSDKAWPDYVMFMTLVLLSLAGGSCVDDVKQLRADSGLCRLFERAILQGASRRLTRQLMRLIGKSGSPFPPPRTVLRWLRDFDQTLEQDRAKQGAATIVPRSESLCGLWRVNEEIVAASQRCEPLCHATLDMDATLIFSKKDQALHTYKGPKGYQPFQIWWAEQQLLVLSEFRDGNVNAGYEQVRLLQDTIEQLPSTVESLSMRSDSAGYQVELLRYCAEGKSERFGVIDFTVSTKVSLGFRNAVALLNETDWKDLVRPNGETTNQQYAEVWYVPDWTVNSKSGPRYRFIAIREPLKLEDGTDPSQLELPFPTHVMDNVAYKLFGLVTNIAADKKTGAEIIWWSRGRAGHSEHFHDVVKNELAGGIMPSGLFGANAAWWAIACISANILTYLKRHFVPPGLRSARPKTLRYRLLNIAGRVTYHARGITVRIAVDHLRLLREIRARIGLRMGTPSAVISVQ